ncbi:NADH-plastoquinone oxidoreductase subunit [Pseudoruegeria aquimaris]|uniref:NADH-plastoquinone oxidoreductase subunit n=1 Tax=Pseudoruegeria aquimaris TaxID=393663 RepID=A0A1Y5S2D0_9RHOB|nr:4Fe-4S dicluster domain-containing protein [Pseudoruegeria aquimaris]SLN30518.1 NADH-plastoquinone oxidoreductase subunit [Pseudoruegeria aquimaris]
MAKQLILCDCLGSQPIDREAIASATGLACSRVHNGLCGRDAQAAAALLEEGEALVACQQERTFFEELAAEIGAPEPAFVDLRDRAGWSDEAAQAAPKMAALAAEALVPPAAEKLMDVTSEGLCLILGPAERTLAAAARLAEALSVTVLLPEPADIPLDRRFDVVVGRLRTASGALGRFSVLIDGLRQIEPGGRGGFGFSAPRDGGRTECDLILDLRGEAPLFPAPEKRDGYLRPDPGDPQAVADAVFEAGQMVGTFEKPLYLAYNEHVCAHARAEQTGCSKCLDICPTGAILPNGEHVAIDPLICAGCGACSALCPSGAITYDDPPVSHLLRRMQVLAETFGKAGGTAPRLLVHDAEHGSEMISLAARFGRGLPADVLPLSVSTVTGFGHSEMLAALALGFSEVSVLLAPRAERGVIEGEAALARAMAGASGAGIHVLDIGDPDALSDHLFTAVAPRPPIEPVLPLGDRRQVARLAAKALNPEADSPVPLPEGAPYGAVLVDTEACTLCLSCVSLCPAGVLLDNEDMPQLRFQEDACLQCGICRTICPEKAIALEPRMNLADTALAQVVLHEEEPYACIECGALFGVKSTVERIVEQLAGKHPMFADSDAGKMIRMCDNCRVNAHFHRENNPFSGGERPRPRTTDDYYSERKDH